MLVWFPAPSYVRTRNRGKEGSVYMPLHGSWNFIIQPIISGCGQMLRCHSTRCPPQILSPLVLGPRVPLSSLSFVPAGPIYNLGTAIYTMDRSRLIADNNTQNAAIAIDHAPTSVGGATLTYISIIYTIYLCQAYLPDTSLHYSAH